MALEKWMRARKCFQLDVLLAGVGQVSWKTAPSAVALSSVADLMGSLSHLTPQMAIGQVTMREALLRLNARCGIWACDSSMQWVKAGNHGQLLRQVLQKYRLLALDRKVKGRVWQQASREGLARHHLHQHHLAGAGGKNQQ